MNFSGRCICRKIIENFFQEGIANAIVYSWKKSLTSTIAYKKAKEGPNINSCREVHKRPSLGLQNEWELFAAGDSINLSNGMSKRTQKWPL